MSRYEKIDIHAHCVPPSWRTDCAEHAHTRPDESKKQHPPWTVEGHLAYMERLNISKSVLSITTPGTNLTPSSSSIAAKTTREANEYMSSLCTLYPERFDFFASLPLPEVSLALEEIDYAFNNLSPAGVALITNTHGVYLGDKRLDPVFDKLNELKATVFIHPTACVHVPYSAEISDDEKRSPEIITPLAGIMPAILEYFFDTTRAVMNLLISGTVTRCPNITFIIPHAGAALPGALERITGFTGQIQKLPGALSSEDAKKLFRERFYFDLAGFPFPDQVHGLLRLLGDKGPERILYGTDFPYMNGVVTGELAGVAERELDELFGEGVVRGIFKGTAEEVLKRA